MSSNSFYDDDDDDNDSGSKIPTTNNMTRDSRGSLSESDDEIAAVMGGDDGSTRTSRSGASRLKNNERAKTATSSRLNGSTTSSSAGRRLFSARSKQISVKTGPGSGSTTTSSTSLALSSGSDLVPTTTNCNRVLARCDLDGYYYPGKVTGPSAISGMVLVAFDDAPLEKSDVSLKHVIAMTGAISRPFIRLNDTVLVLIRNGLTGLYCYIPGIVAVAPLSDQLQAKCYSIVAYNRRTVTAFRYQLVRIAEAKFTATVGYIAERARLMGIKPLAPLTKKRHFGLKSSAKSKSPTRLNGRRTAPIPKIPLEPVERNNKSKQAPTQPSQQPPRRLSPMSSARSSHGGTDSGTSRTMTPVEKSIQAPGSNMELVELNGNLNEMVDRALSPINLIDPTSKSAITNEPEPPLAQIMIQVPTAPNQSSSSFESSSSSSSSSSSESDSEGGVVRPERRRRRFEPMTPLDGSFAVGQTVLARSSDDGWFYRWKVEADLGNGAYALRNKLDPEDSETAWKEHIFQLPGRSQSGDADVDNADDGDRIVEGDCVIAKRPDFQQTYCPGSVEGVDSNGDLLTVKFCDHLSAPVNRVQCFKVAQKVFNEAVMFIKHCEDRWIGERVVVLNPSRHDGGFEPLAGNYVIGIVRERDKGAEKRYLVELAPELVASTLISGNQEQDDERDQDEPFMVRQSIDHIFGRFTKSRKLHVGDFVLAPSDRNHQKRRGCTIYLPGTVRAVKRNNKLLTVKLANGAVVDGLKAKDVFWLRSDYYEGAEHFYRAHHLPDALKRNDRNNDSPDLIPTAKKLPERHHHQHKEQEPASRQMSLAINPPKIVIEDFDTQKITTSSAMSSKASTPDVSENKPFPPPSALKKSNPPSSQPKTSPARSVSTEEAVKKCEVELSNGGSPELVMQWIRDGSVKCSERLGDMAAQYDKTLARAIYLRSSPLPEKKVMDGVDSKELARQLLASLIQLDPESSVQFGKLLMASNWLDVDGVVQVFLNSPNKAYQQCVDFMLEAIDDNDHSHAAQLETQALDACSLMGKEHLDRLLASGRFTRYEKQKAITLCKKNGLYERWIEQLQFVDDIKAILGEHAFEMDIEWLVKFFESMSPDDMFDCIEEMLLSNKSGRQNLPAAIRLVKKFHKTLDVNNIIELLERLQMTNELFLVLQTVVASSRNPIMTTKLIEVACLVDRITEAEQVCRDPNAVFFAEVVWEFLVAAKLPKTGRLMAFMCDRFHLVEQFVRFCHENNQYRLLEAYVSRINPSAMHDVVDALKAVGADSQVVERIVTTIAPPPPNNADRISQNGYVE